MNYIQKNLPDRTNELNDVSRRINELEAKNLKLTNQLTESKESILLILRDNKALKQKIEDLSIEKKAIEEKYYNTDKRQSFSKYTAKFKSEFNELKKKYEDLEIQYNELKRIKNSRFDPLLMQRVIDRAIERNNTQNTSANTLTDKQIVNRMKNAEELAESFRRRYEETHSLLEKSKDTVVRLNQLLTRKETQLTEFHKIIADLKQQIIVLKGEKSE